MSSPTEQAEDPGTEDIGTDFSKMTKAELLQYAAEHGIEVNDSMTKAEIIAAIEAAEG